MGRKVCGEDLCDPLGMKSERNRRPQQVVCDKAGDDLLGVKRWKMDLE